MESLAIPTNHETTVESVLEACFSVLSAFGADIEVLDQEDLGDEYEDIDLCLFEEDGFVHIANADPFKPGLNEVANALHSRFTDGLFWLLYDDNEMSYETRVFGTPAVAAPSAQPEREDGAYLVVKNVSAAAMDSAERSRTLMVLCCGAVPAPLSKQLPKHGKASLQDVEKLDLHKRAAPSPGEPIKILAGGMCDHCEHPTLFPFRVEHNAVFHGFRPEQKDDFERGEGLNELMDEAHFIWRPLLSWKKPARRS